MRHLLASLTSRLVLTAVALVVLVAVLIGAAATAALNAQLTHQLDDDLHSAAGFRGGHGPEGPGPGGLPQTTMRGSATSAGVRRRSGRSSATPPVAGTSSPGVAKGRISPTRSWTRSPTCPPTATCTRSTSRGSASYRVIAVDGSLGTEVTGLPTEQVDEAVTSLIGWEALLIALGALLAAGGGLLLVRRQLRPLTEVAATAHAVAALPLSEGDIDLTERVPDHLTDERTEVGQVGAALNTLLAHVETSLEARHRSEQQVRQFVADASHELRTPLTTIAGYTELARRRPDDDNLRTALGKVEEESARMTSLVEDMLLLARLDDGRPLDREPVDLTRLLVEAVDDARVVGPDHRWRLDLPDAVPQPVEVIGDEQRLHQVVTNLLTNARKHTPAGTTVTVTVRADGFDVHDDGPGFPRTSWTTRSSGSPGSTRPASARLAQGGGAGLGLSLVEAIVRSHGGTVTLDSAPGGTTIAVRLR